MYSLGYYDKIFGLRGPAFWELVAALEVQLEAYADAVPGVLATRDPGALAQLRHDHRPMVQNLSLDQILALEIQLREALETGASEASLQDLGRRFRDQAREVARALGSERTRA